MWNLEVAAGGEGGATELALLSPDCQDKRTLLALLDIEMETVYTGVKVEVRKGGGRQVAGKQSKEVNPVPFVTPHPYSPMCNPRKHNRAGYEEPPRKRTDLMPSDARRKALIIQAFTRPRP